MVDLTVDGNVQLYTHTERDVDAAARDQAVNHRHVVGAGPQAQGPPSPEAAGRQVVVGDIPVEPPGFRPRADLLTELDQAGDRVSVIHAVTGLPGLGATQLAAAYARAKLAAGWPLVAWVNGADTGSLLAGLAVVADATGLTDDGTGRGIADAGAAVRHWLEADGDRCLLVFDDVSDPEMLQPYVPAHGTGRVLIITTRQSAANLGRAVPVDVFSAYEASAFLIGRTGLDDAAGAAEVAAELGHLPLALALAAPVIAGQHMGYAGYLYRLRAMPADVSLDGEDGQPHPAGVAEAVLLSMQAVRAADRTGVCTRVMEIMALLSAAGVRREQLHAAGRAGMLASGGRRVAAVLVDQVLEWLSDRSLLTFSLDGQTIILHRQVALVILSGLVRRGSLAAAGRAAAFVLDASSRALVGSQDRWAVRGIPQQVKALLNSTAGLATQGDEELARVLLRLRFIAFYHLLELGDSTPQAIVLGEPLTADLEGLLGPDHPDTLNSRNSLAAAYLAAGRVGEAIPLLEQALVVRQRMLGPDDPGTLTSQNNLASAYQDAGRTAEAIRLYELNLEVRERLLGPDHPSTLNSRGNLAAAYRDGGRVGEAIPLFEQTLADRERVLGPGHSDTQTSRKNLAQAYRAAGRVGEAIPLEQILDGRKRLLGRDRPGTPTSAKNSGDAYRDGGRVAEAIPPAEQVPAARKSQPPAGAAGQLLPADFRRPPADPARRGLPAGFRRPPAGPAKLNGHSSTSRTPDPPPRDVEYDRQVIAAIIAGNPAGIAMAYDRYAAALYGYCHWMLHDPAGAAEAVQDTFVTISNTVSDLPEAPELRPRLYAVARNECRRRIRTTAATRMVSQSIDAPDGLARVNGDRGPAELQALVRSVLAGLKPGEREVIELSFRHDLYDNDLAIALGVSWSRADALGSRAQGQLEEALRALRIAFTRREACPVLGELLAEWDGQLTEQTRDLVGWHIEECLTCANYGRSAPRPAAFSRLLPLAPLPPELRDQVLSRCTSTAEDAVAYRRRVARHAGSIRFARFSRAVRQVSWDSIRANPGPAIVAVAVAVWVLAAVSVMLLTFGGSHPAR